MDVVPGVSAPHLLHHVVCFEVGQKIDDAEGFGCQRHDRHSDFCDGDESCHLRTDKGSTRTQCEMLYTEVIIPVRTDTFFNVNRGQCQYQLKNTVSPHANFVRPTHTAGFSLGEPGASKQSVTFPPGAYTSHSYRPASGWSESGITMIWPIRVGCLVDAMAFVTLVRRREQGPECNPAQETWTYHISHVGAGRGHVVPTHERPVSASYLGRGHEQSSGKEQERHCCARCGTCM